MQKKSLLAISLTLLLGMASCYEPVMSESPVYVELRFTTLAPSEITLDKHTTLPKNSTFAPGDSVTAFMQVSYTGAYITEADYHWRLYVGDSVVSEVVNVIAPHKQDAPPMWRFKAPDTKGKYEVGFKAKYDYSAQTATGQIYGESSSYSAKLSVGNSVAE